MFDESRISIEESVRGRIESGEGFSGEGGEGIVVVIPYGWDGGFDFADGWEEDSCFGISGGGVGCERGGAECNDGCEDCVEEFTTLYFILLYYVMVANCTVRAINASNAGGPRRIETGRRC